MTDSIVAAVQADLEQRSARGIAKVCEFCGSGFVLYCRPSRAARTRFCSFSCGGKNAAKARLAKQMTPQNALRRFFEKVAVAGPADCWEWTAHIQRNGYGSFLFEGDTYAHRASLRLHGQNIPAGMVVDHICRNRRCVNPAHLRVVTRGENVTENSESFAAVNKRKTHCAQGHAYDELNTMHTGRGRRCRACRKTWRAASKERSRLARTPS